MRNYLLDKQNLEFATRLEAPVVILIDGSEYTIESSDDIEMTVVKYSTDPDCDILAFNNVDEDSDDPFMDVRDGNIYNVSKNK